MIYTCKILSYDGERLVIKPDESIDRDLLQKQVKRVELRLTDGREITAEQRRKIFALIRDISVWCGHEPEYIRAFMEFEYRIEKDIEPFSLSDCDVTTAREFINYLINFCFENDVPTKKPLLTQADDIGKYLYYCLEHRKCAICNAPADVHHVDTIGMGNNRQKVIHMGKSAIALCRAHHTEAHTIGANRFFDKYKVFGIKLDDYLCTILKLKKENKS